MWFLKWASGQTNEQTNALITILSCPPGSYALTGKRPGPERRDLYAISQWKTAAELRAETGSRLAALVGRLIRRLMAQKSAAALLLSGGRSKHAPRWSYTRRSRAADKTPTNWRVVYNVDTHATWSDHSHVVHGNRNYTQSHRVACMVAQYAARGAVIRWSWEVWR